MERKLIKKDIIHRHKDKPIRWKDIKDIQFEDEDEIKVAYDEGFYSENNSWDPYHYVIVTREILETDEEMVKRVAKESKQKEEMRNRRYEQYLKLKKEFEGQ
jgi:hypothetical protein